MSSSRALTRLAGSQLGARASQQLASPARIANLTSSARSKAFASTLTAKSQPTTAVSRQFRRTYADAAPVKAKKPRRFRFFRWTWRLTYLSILGGLGYVVYDGYASRHPDEQFNPDPKKKTLVVLGKFLDPISSASLAGLLPRSPRPGVLRPPSGLTCATALQVPAGAPSPSSRRSTRRTTTSL